MKTADLQWDENKTRTWQRKLYALRYSCGCTTGMIVMLLSLGISIFYFLYVAAHDYSSARKTGMIFLSCFSGALVGKVAGMIGARMRYRFLKKKLEKNGFEATTVLTGCCN
jgi:NhaP-type Na+/H+ or K+/H+ antiporter